MVEVTTEGAASVADAVRWREAMHRALYGESGFFVREADRQPVTGAFRTSVHASPLFATAVLRLLTSVDDALERPDPLEVVDVGAGTGDLLRRIALLAPTYLRRRLRLRAVELAPAPGDLPEGIDWQADLPEPASVTGVVWATEWLDNVPLDIAEVCADGDLRYLLVDPASGAESPGGPLNTADATWARRWWPWAGLPPGARVELGTDRDGSWAAAVRSLDRGLALTVDYGHLAPQRPRLGTLTGFRAGREVDPVPDGSCDLTAHVALDAVRDAGEAVAGRPALLTTQAEALRALGLDAARPPRSLAAEDPAGYVHALSAASQAAELVDPAGLGAHLWLLQPVRLPSSALPLGLRP
jgi:SAM-dependent MidA family methyltransferase